WSASAGCIAAIAARRRAYLLLRSGVVRELGQDDLMNELSGEICVVGARNRTCNARPVSHSRVFDQLAGLLGRCRGFFLLSFDVSLGCRSSSCVPHVGSLDQLLNFDPPLN